MALLQHRSVEADSSAPAIRARVGADEFVDIGVGNRSRGCAHRGECVLSQELALAAGEQHLGDVGRGENADVPGTVVGDVSKHFEAEPGQTHLNCGETEYVLRVRGREAEDGRPADILPGEVDRAANIELFNDEVQVFGGGPAVIPARPVVGVAKATQIDGENTVARRKQRNELSKRPPGFRKPMDQQDRRSAGSRCDGVQPGSVYLNAVVRDPRQRETNWSNLPAFMASGSTRQRNHPRDGWLLSGS